MAFLFLALSLFLIPEKAFPWWDDAQVKIYSISFDTEFYGTNYDDYNSSKIYQQSRNRDNVINYHGGGQYLAGLSTRIDLDKNGKYWVHLSYRSTLLTGDENDSSGNLTDHEFLNENDSFILETFIRLGRIVGDFKYFSLSNGKIKLSDTSGDSKGNEGIELGYYQLLIKRYQISTHYKFKNFPFYMGFRYMNTRLPRMPYTYEARSFRGAGDLQFIKYQSLLVSLELGESEFIPMSKESGLKWSMGFAMGLGEFDFLNDNNVQLNESSSMFHIKFAWGYQFDLNPFFVRFDNSAHLMSLDNNDGSLDASANTVYRTGGADEEYRVMLRFGKILN